jgi:hypothetical protein
VNTNFCLGWVVLTNNKACEPVISFCFSDNNQFSYAFTSLYHSCGREVLRVWDWVTTSMCPETSSKKNWRATHTPLGCDLQVSVYGNKKNKITTTMYGLYTEVILMITSFHYS